MWILLCSAEKSCSPKKSSLYYLWDLVNGQKVSINDNNTLLLKWINYEVLVSVLLKLPIACKLHKVFYAIFTLRLCICLWMVSKQSSSLHVSQFSSVLTMMFTKQPRLATCTVTKFQPRQKCLKIVDIIINISSTLIA